MNQPALQRTEKLLNLVKNNPAGMFDHQIAENLKWNTNAVRAVCGILKKSGKVIIKSNQNKWFILADDEKSEQVEYIQDEDTELRQAAVKFGNSLSELIYVIFHNRK